MRYAFALSLCLAAAVAQAGTERCLLQVDGRAYIKGPCATLRQDNGSLMVGSDGNRISSPYFAQITPNEDGSADGFWNEIPKSTHAQSSLGTLKRSGTCWINARATVCAER